MYLARAATYTRKQYFYITSETNKTNIPIKKMIN